MDRFPRTFSVVREASVCAVTVRNNEELLNLRTELELVLRAGQAAAPGQLALLERRLDRLHEDNGIPGGPRVDHVDEMCGILRDAGSMINHTTAACIDVDFPDIPRKLNMAIIDSETKRFEADMTAELATDLEATPTPAQPAYAASEAGVDTLNSESTTAETGQASDSVDIADELLAMPSAVVDAAVDEEVQQTVDEVAELTRSLELAIGLPEDLTPAALGLAAEEPRPACPGPQASQAAVAATSKPCSPETQSTADFRGQILEIRSQLVQQMDRLAEVFEQAIAMQSTARQALDEVRQVESATLAAQERSREYTTAQQQAQAARIAFEQANARVDQTRTAWESAEATVQALTQRLHHSAAPGR